LIGIVGEFGADSVHSTFLNTGEAAEDDKLVIIRVDFPLRRFEKTFFKIFGKISEFTAYGIV
jgi:hypothetical protein